MEGGREMEGGKSETDFWNFAQTLFEGSPNFQHGTVVQCQKTGSAMQSNHQESVQGSGQRMKKTLSHERLGDGDRRQ